MKRGQEKSKTFVLNGKRMNSYKNRKEDNVKHENRDEFKKYNVTQYLPFTIRWV